MRTRQFNILIHFPIILHSLYWEFRQYAYPHLWLSRCLSFSSTEGRKSTSMGVRFNFLFFFLMCSLIDSYAYLRLPQEDTAVCRQSKHRGCCGPFVDWACPGSQKRLLADTCYACLRVQSMQRRVGVSPLQTTLTSALCKRARVAWPFGMPQQDLSLSLTKWPAWVFSYQSLLLSAAGRSTIRLLYFFLMKNPGGRTGIKTPM